MRKSAGWLLSGALAALIAAATSTSLDAGRAKAARAAAIAAPAQADELLQDRVNLQARQGDLREALAAAGVEISSFEADEATDAGPPPEEGELTHWLTLSSKKRHNSSCKWYKNSKGRPCRADEGIACNVCGG